MPKSLWIFLFLTLLLLLFPSFESAPPPQPPSVRIVKSPLRHFEVQNAEVQLSVLVNQGYEIAGFAGSHDNGTYDYVWTLVKKNIA
uniref:Peptidase_M14 domain-containing protein n=1 Tax=Globodera pallida TaxID=36090 RepID=A0A183CA33_GLOPA